MKTFHIHIGGLVQGVGFRPYVFHLAESYQITGWVSNSKNGVHIEFNADEARAREFYKAIIQSPPSNAVLTSHTIKSVPPRQFSSFTLQIDETDQQPDLLLTPDLSICENCRKEIINRNNKRYHYPFTTCLECGPRFSIIRELPYERHHTTMEPLQMCDDCKAEYNDIDNRRHYSQTNSCPGCGIPMHLYDSSGQLQSNNTDDILQRLQQILAQGSIAAVKGIGGYLLLCDATNELSIKTLRQRKHRPAKPFALLYNNIETVRTDVYLSDEEEKALKDKAGPIILCRIKQSHPTNICIDEIAPGLDKIGIMLPCSPLLQLISSSFINPLIATSANISGSSIIYKDDEAIELLSSIADFVITYDREIVLPQDDSVMQITAIGKKNINRRSRGLAPNYFPNPFPTTDECILATGAELKSAFALQNKHQLFVSQYIGNQENLASQTAYSNTMNHLLKLMNLQPSLLLADKHPGYFVSLYAGNRSLIENIPLCHIQHHMAHFGAVLAENNLMNSDEPILGVIWDGTGYGDDKQIWGGEFFLYENKDMQRVAHLDYFPQLLGDKMSRDPRLAALSLLKQFPAKQTMLQPFFSEPEWKFFQQLIRQQSDLLTSSIGRFLDGIASLLNICHLNTYEGEAAMKLEATARRHLNDINDYYPMPLNNNCLEYSVLLQELLEDISKNKDRGYIAKKVFWSLAKSIEKTSDSFLINKIAFSGGVFQNALLVDMINELLAGKKELYWHRQLSPNDECIGFGQLACYHTMMKNNKANIHKKESIYG